MTNLVILPKLTGAMIAEFARMLLARKLMTDDRRGILSPMVNAPLAQCVLLQENLPLILVEWLPRLKGQFAQEIADPEADPSLSQFLERLENDEARAELIGQYFLPYSPMRGFGDFSVRAITDAFDEPVRFARPPFDMGPLYPTMPQDGSIVLPEPFAWSIFDQLLIGRHSQLHLETRRIGATDDDASDQVIRILMKALATSGGSDAAEQPFRKPALSNEDFVQSFAYAQMMELGFSQDEMMAALAPWSLVD